MEPGIYRDKFTKDDLSLVAGFSCGTHQWELYLSDWITGKPDGVLEALDKGTEVWLYRNEHDEIVGYGSLGVTQWKYPEPFGQQHATLAIIPALAIQAPFRGKPDGPWENHYSVQIMSDLVSVARQWHTANRFPDPLLGLFVDVRNIRAQTFYVQFGFGHYGERLRDKESGTIRQRMILSLLDRTTLPTWSQPVARTEAPPVADDSRDTEQTSTPPPFKQALAAILNAPPTPGQQAKKGAAKARREERKRQKEQQSEQ